MAKREARLPGLLSIPAAPATVGPAQSCCESFWVDRWSGSTAFGLPLEARGLYREMLSQAWRRGGRLPADPVTIRRYVAATDREWRRSWPLIRRYWRVEGASLVNDTQLEVYKKTMAARARRSAAGAEAAAARWRGR